MKKLTTFIFALLISIGSLSAQNTEIVIDLETTIAKTTGVAVEIMGELMHEMNKMVRTLDVPQVYVEKQEVVLQIPNNVWEDDCGNIHMEMKDVVIYIPEIDMRNCDNNLDTDNPVDHNKLNKLEERMDDIWTQ